MPERLATLMIAATFVGLVLGTCAGCVGARVRMSTTEPQQRDRAVRVQVWCGEMTHSGSGVIVDNTRVMTAAHVGGCLGGTILVTRSNGKQHRMRLEAFAARADLARLVIADGTTFDLPRLRIAGVWPGERVCIIAAAPERVMSCGVVDKITDEPEHLPDAVLPPGMIYHDAVTIPGNSGSALYDSRGRLVGIVVRMRGEVKEPLGGIATELASRRFMVYP